MVENRPKIDNNREKTVFFYERMDFFLKNTNEWIFFPKKTNESIFFKIAPPGANKSKRGRGVIRMSRRKLTKNRTNCDKTVLFLRSTVLSRFVRLIRKKSYGCGKIQFVPIVEKIVPFVPTSFQPNGS